MPTKSDMVACSWIPIPFLIMRNDPSFSAPEHVTNCLIFKQKQNWYLNINRPFSKHTIHSQPFCDLTEYMHLWEQLTDSWWIYCVQTVVFTICHLEKILSSTQFCCNPRQWCWGFLTMCVYMSYYTLHQTTLNNLCTYNNNRSYHLGSCLFSVKQINTILSFFLAKLKS